MEENEDDAQRTDVADAEHEEAEEASTQRSTIGKLVVGNLLGHVPAEEQASKQATSGQEYLTCQEVKPVEQRFSTDDQPAAGIAKRQGAEHPDNGT